VSSGLDWVFEQVEEAIILEDDCLPHPHFFRFSQELLTKYRHDGRIGIISGDNFQFGKQRTNNSYYFSRYAHIWGWASWRRTWREYDVEIKKWPTVKKGGWMADLFSEKKLVNYWTNIFDSVYQNQIDTWDYQLNFSIWVNSQLNIMPVNNLVSNIGFGPDASKTTSKNSFLTPPLNEMKFPLVHPTMFIRDALADKKTENDQFNSSIILRIINKIQRKLK